jgi:hypothetical protein
MATDIAGSAGAGNRAVPHDNALPAVWCWRETYWKIFKNLLKDNFGKFRERKVLGRRETAPGGQAK